jgi:hypothetical protein
LPLANRADPGRPANPDAAVPRAMPWPCRRGGLPNRLSISPAGIKGCCRSLRTWPSRHRPPWPSPRWTLCVGRFLGYPKQWNSPLDHPRASTDTSWPAPPLSSPESHLQRRPPPASAVPTRRHGCAASEHLDQTLVVPRTLPCLSPAIPAAGLAGIQPAAPSSCPKGRIVRFELLLGCFVQTEDLAVDLQIFPGVF